MKEMDATGDPGKNVGLTIEDTDIIKQFKSPEPVSAKTTDLIIEDRSNDRDLSRRKSVAVKPMHTEIKPVSSIP